MDIVLNSVMQHFKCNHCGFYLTPPVTQCIQNHVLCSQCCIDRNNCIICRENFSPTLARTIGDIGNKLLFPCPYETNGCAKISNWSKLNEHKNECDFRNYNCPVDSLACKWSGPVIKLQEHFLEGHTNDSDVHFTNNNTISFDVDLSDPYYKLSLIVMANKVFLMHVIRPNKTTCTKVHLQYLGVKKDADLFEYQLELRNSNRTKCVFKGPVTYYSPEIIEQTKQIVIDDCQMFDTVQILLKIKLRNQIKLNESLLKKLECPVCTEYMCTPIYQCIVGHSLCSKCKQKINSCPSCNSAMGDQRNFGLESITEDIFAPCSFAKDGCTEFAELYKIKFHETDCTFGNFNCSKQGCIWRGKLNEMLGHVKSVHGLFSVGNIKWIDVINNHSIKEIVEVHGQPFYFDITLDGRDIFHFLVRGFNEYSKFLFTIKINVKDFNKPRIVISEKCSSHLVTLESAIELGETISIPFEKITSFLGDDGDLDYYLSIHKID